LSFVESPALAPPEVPLDNDQMQKYEVEIQIAQNTPLPDEEDNEF